MSEYSQDHPPEIGLDEVAPAFKQLRGRVLLTCLVFGPSIPSISARLCLFRNLVQTPLVWEKAWEDEDGFYPESFEGAEIGLDALGERERETACCGQKRLPRRWAVQQELKIVRRIDSKTRIRESGDRQRLQVLPLGKIIYAAGATLVSNTFANGKTMHFQCA